MIATTSASTTILATVLLALAATAGAAEAPGGTYAQWLKHRTAVGKDPAVVRYYTFEGARGPDDPIRNLADGGADPLTFRMEPAPGAPKDQFRLTAGRWPAKPAIRLDQGSLVAAAPPVPQNAFTAILWFRKNGQGAHRGNSGNSNGMLVAVGDGYWAGWRLTTAYPLDTIGFEIGRPQPSSSVGITAHAVSDGVWHHLAATWDGKQMRLYVDGELAAAGDYAGAYTPPPNGGPLRIGYADSGVGSAILDVDELTIYRRALSSEEIVRDFYFYTNMSAAQLAQWSAANAASAEKEPAAAEKAWADLLKTQGLHPDLALVARLRLLDLQHQQGQAIPAATVQDLARALDNPAVPSRLQRQALSSLLNLLRSGAAVPPVLYERFLTMPQLSPADRLAVRLGFGHSLAGAGNDAGARQQYAKIADAADSPAPWRSLALMSMARACVLAGDYPAAKAIYEKIRALPGEPRHHKAEVDERLGEIARLQAGKPARDPLASRVQLPRLPRPGATLYVAPDGKDTNPGTQQRPFATLKRARDQIRTLRKNRGLPAGGVVVLIRGGRYPVTDTFKLAAEDSGTSESPIVYRAAPAADGQPPLFDAGERIRGFEPVRDPAILARLPEEAREGKVFQTDLKAQGITSFGAFELGGFASARGSHTHPLLELFFNGKAMPMARWPNHGYIHMDDVPKDAKGVFTYTDERPARWKDEKDPWLYGYWFYDWADCYEKVASIDPGRKRITLAPPFSTYGEGGAGLRAGQRFCAVNMLCEIDEPGEWYLDRASGILYFYPPADPQKATIEVSMLEKPVMELDGVSHVRFEGLVWANGRADAVLVRGGESCLFAGCTVRQFAGNGIEIRDGTRHGILSCDIHTLGRGGTILAGGDRKTLTPGGHFVENCHIHSFSRIDHTYTPAVMLSGVGNRIVHNLMDHGNSSAMRIDGNDHLVEFNQVHHMVLDSDDQGGSDMWANPTYRGNVFRYNYWHDSGNGLPVGQAGIRLDDVISGVAIYGNIFQRCAGGTFGGVQINGGKENYIENNLFIDCKAAISGGSGDEQRWRTFLSSEMGRHELEEVKPTQPPYSQRYPELLHLEGNLINSIWRNVAIDCRVFLRDEQRTDQMDNWVTGGNPGLADPAKGNFAVQKGSALWNHLSFQPIPSDEIGLYTDQYRKPK